MSGPRPDAEPEGPESPQDAEPGSNGMPGAESLVGRLCRWTLQAAARVVPFRERSAWREEWLGELWALRRRGVGAVGLARFAAGGVRHALWERREEEGAMGGGLWQDARTAARRLRRSPGFTAVILAVLGLGVGANTALYSALHQALLRPSPYPDADRLVLVDLLLARNQDAPLDTMPWSWPKFELARERLTSVESVAAFSPRNVTLTGAGDATRLTVEFVSPAYFDLLGVRAAVGRTFDASHEPPSPGTVALLTHGLWSTRFGADPNVVGRTVTLDGAPFEVVGVLPPGFRGLSGGADAWAPIAGVAAVMGPRRLEAEWSHWFRVLGRLRPGASLEQARAELADVGAALTATYPDPSGGGVHGATAVPFLRARVNPVARLAVAAASAGGLVLLLIACANVAGLFLARASSRRTDVAVRAALGAGAGRLAREHLLESLLLAAGAGALGMVLAVAGEGLVRHAVRSALRTSGSRGLEYLDPSTLAVDGWVLAVGLGLAAAAGLVFGLLPARAATQPDLHRDLRAAAPGSVGRRGDAGRTLRGVLVSTQLALTLMLLAGAGLMATSFGRLAGVATGFAHDDVLTLRFDRGPGRSPDEDRAFESTLLERLGSIPGVASVAVGPCPPLTGPCEVTGIRRLDDGPEVDFGDMEGIVTYAVSDAYFETLGIDVLTGRTLDPPPSPGDPPVAVVNEAAARQLFGGTALGHRIAVTHELTSEAQAEIVGVVADVRYGALEEEVMPALYFSRRQSPGAYGVLFVRAAGDPYAVVEAVRREVAAVAPELPLTDVLSMGDRRVAATARTRVILGLMGAFAALALLLSAVGLYGVVSYAVARRTREMGLRLALGAAARDVVGLVVSGPALVAASGALLGLAGALVLNRYMEGLLFGVEPGDPRVLAAAAVVLLAVAATAACLPALRATRLDPASTLRQE